MAYKFNIVNVQEEGMISDFKKVNLKQVVDYPSRKPEVLYIFMIGGSGSTIMKPYIHFFSHVTGFSDCTIKPVFIDRNFNSKNVSDAINSISRYERYCVYSMQDCKIDPPLFFCEERIEDLKSSKKLQEIISCIGGSDKVLMVYSTYNILNIQTKDYLVESIRKVCADAEIYHTVFLPYFKIGNQRLHDLISRERIEDELNIGSKEYMTLLGMPKLCTYIRQTFQCNPFSLTSLVASYIINQIIGNKSYTSNGYRTYSIANNSTLVPLDIIPSKEFRRSLIYSDMKSLCWSFLGSTHNSIIQYISSESYEYVNLFLKESVDMLIDLGDSTITEKSFVMKYRADGFNSQDLSANFIRYKLLFMRNRANRIFLKRILGNVNIAKAQNERVIISEIITSINKFITDNFDEIDKLYL